MSPYNTSSLQSSFSVVHVHPSTRHFPSGVESDSVPAASRLWPLCQIRWADGHACASLCLQETFSHFHRHAFIHLLTLALVPVPDQGSRPSCYYFDDVSATLSHHQVQVRKTKTGSCFLGRDAAQENDGPVCEPKDRNGCDQVASCSRRRAAPA